MRLNLAVSACLLGSEVRYDGSGKRQVLMLQQLQEFAELTGFCPEVEAGLGIPREPIQLVQRGADIRVLQVSDPAIDRTESLRNCARRQHWLGSVDGYIFKARSPSCGVATTPLWNSRGDQLRLTDGEFVRSIRASYPNLPMIDEEQWREGVVREEFIRLARLYRADRIS